MVTPTSSWATRAVAHVAAASSEGKLLLFELAELPVLGRGKGVQTINPQSEAFVPKRTRANDMAREIFK